MYEPTASDAAPQRAPARPAWLRLVRTPLSTPERDALATQHGTMSEPYSVASLLGPRARAEEVECSYVIALDCKLRPVAVQEVSRGSLVASVVSPREVFRLAVLLGAFAIIVAHNHPSGDPAPSPEDLVLTRRLVDAGVVLGIPVVDHVIVAGVPAASTSWWFSFQEHGLLGKA